MMDAAIGRPHGALRQTPYGDGAGGASVTISGGGDRHGFAVTFPAVDSRPHRQ